MRRCAVPASIWGVKAITVSRLNSTLFVVGGGMLLGHVVFPYSAGRGPLVRLTFYLAVGVIGAARGLRDATLRHDAPRARIWRAVAFAAASVALAWLAYEVVHGR